MIKLSPKVINYLGGKFALVARYHLAGIFILSGASKAIDPYGLSIKIGEYFSAFGLDALRTLSQVGGILLPAAELLLGLMLLTGLSRKLSAWGSILSMGFFTLLTLYLAIANPISDCGCFGDLIHLTNWETFFKNVIFLPFAITFFWARNREQPHSPSLTRSIVTYSFIIPISIGLSLYSYIWMPPIDPTPFRVGVNIPQAMQSDESALETVLIYRNTQSGKLQDFNIDDTTWYDTSKWEYVDTRTTGSSSGPAIKSMAMFGAEGDRSDEILSRSGYTLIYVFNDYKADYMSQIEQFGNYIQSQGGITIALSSTPLPTTLPAAGIETLSSDNSLMRTMIQHPTGGAILLDGGTIIGKWPINSLPQWQQGNPLSHSLTSLDVEREELLVVIFSLIITILTLATHTHILAKSNKKQK